MKSRPIELENKIVELRKQGMQIWEIARNLGLTRGQVQSALRKRDVIVQPKLVKPPFGYQPRPTAEQMRRMAAEGFSIHDIAYHFGDISSDAVARAIAGDEDVPKKF